LSFAWKGNRPQSGIAHPFIAHRNLYDNRNSDRDVPLIADIIFVRSIRAKKRKLDERLSVVPSWDPTRYGVGGADRSRVLESGVDEIRLELFMARCAELPH